MATLLDKIRSPVFKALGIKSAVLDGIRISTDPNCPTMRRLRSDIFTRTYEAPERAMIARLIAPSDRVLDLGVCVGVTTAICAKTVGSENVLGYEANPNLRSAIDANFALNGLTPNIRYRAITSDARPVTFHLAKNSYSSSMADRGLGEPIEIESDALDSVLSEFGPTMLLMDVEGAEDELVQSSDLPGVLKIVIEVHPHIIGKDAVSGVLARIVSLGFRQQSSDGLSFAFMR